MALVGGGDLVGRVLADRYRLLNPIGSGGSGRVHITDDLTLKRQVAVKVLLDRSTSRSPAEGCIVGSPCMQRRTATVESTVPLPSAVQMDAATPLEVTGPAMEGHEDAPTPEAAS